MPRLIPGMLPQHDACLWIWLGQEGARALASPCHTSALLVNVSCVQEEYGSAVKGAVSCRTGNRQFHQGSRLSGRPMFCIVGEVARLPWHPGMQFSLDGSLCHASVLFPEHARGYTDTWHVRVKERAHLRGYTDTSTASSPASFSLSARARASTKEVAKYRSLNGESVYTELTQLHWPM
jgi:hypothetical protein